jgi:hypothetical protein
MVGCSGRIVGGEHSGGSEQGGRIRERSGKIKENGGGSGSVVGRSRGMGEDQGA